MVQLNLLPDVKLEYLKAQRIRRLVYSVALLASALSVILLIVMLSINGLQKKHLNDLSRDITKETSQLQHKPQINQILTVQHQLQSLTALHASKPAASRLFDYLNSVTPVQVNITTFTTDFTAKTASITGTADALSSVNKYIDNLKVTSYTTDSNPTATKAFSNIVLTSFGLSNGQEVVAASNQPATYTITLVYDGSIFDIVQKINLSVPSQITTRPEVAQPTDLFQKAPTPAASSRGNR